MSPHKTQDAAGATMVDLPRRYKYLESLYGELSQRADSAESGAECCEHDPRRWREALSLYQQARLTEESLLQLVPEMEGLIEEWAEQQDGW